jgi:hypothetical protein
MKVKKTISDISHSLLGKYFYPLGTKDYVPDKLENINEQELKDLLTYYELIPHIDLFKDLAKMIPDIMEEYQSGKEYLKVRDELYNEAIDLVNFSIRLMGMEIGWIEIKSNLGDSIKIQKMQNLLLFGNYIYNGFKSFLPYSEIFQHRQFNQEGDENKYSKTLKKKGRQSSKFALAWLVMHILNFLNKETTLKTDKVKVTNQQARFIYDFLCFAKAIQPDSTSVLDEEYIRSMINNYQKVFPKSIS